MVLATLKRAPSELSSFARKIFKIDDHLGIAASGLASDGRVLCRYMRNECLNHKCAPDFDLGMSRVAMNVQLVQVAELHYLASLAALIA